MARREALTEGLRPGEASMSRDPTAGRLTPLWLWLLLPRVGALRPDELFPYGESQGDQLLPQGDDESSAAVRLAIPLRFYDAQFSDLYVSLGPGGARLGEGLEASSQGVLGVEQPLCLAVVPLGTRLCHGAAAS